MMKRWICLALALALAMTCAAMGLAEETAPVDAVIIGTSEGAADALILVHADSAAVRMLTVDPETLPIDITRDAEGLMADVNEVYDLSMDKYVSIPLDDLAHVVEAVGGVTMEIKDADMDVELPDGALAFEASGKQHITGAQAAALLSSGNKDQLGERRRRTFEALLNIARGGELDLNGDLLTETMELCETNFTFEDVLTLGLALLSEDGADIQTKRGPLTGEASGEAEAAAVKAYLNS